MPDQTNHLRRRGTSRGKAVGESQRPDRRTHLAEASAAYLVSGPSREVPGAIQAALEPILSSLEDLPHPVTPSVIKAVGRVIDASTDPLRAAFLARALNALASLAPRLRTSVLGDAVGSRSDYAVLLEALEEPDALAALEQDDPFAEARLRDLEIRDTILQSEGGVLTVEQVARQLGITRQAVDKRRRSGELLALPVARHRYAYPAWQFLGVNVLPGLEDVLVAFSIQDPWTQAAFFLGENTLLAGERPLDVLRRGDVEPVRRAAWALGEQGSA